MHAFVLKMAEKLFYLGGKSTFKNILLFIKTSPRYIRTLDLRFSSPKFYPLRYRNRHRTLLT